MTGASSFSGAYIAKEFLNQGHEVISISISNYENFPIKRMRIQELQKLRKKLFTIQIDEFKNISREVYDILVLHGSSMENRKSVNFDVTAAVDRTVAITKIISRSQIGTVIHTGTFSEPHESIYDNPESLDSYSTSKSIIYDEHKKIFDGFPVHKYVLPNPFGKMQNENIFTSAMTTWKKGDIFLLQKPWLVRDFVPADLIARDYVKFAKNLHHLPHSYAIKRAPSLYVCTLRGMVEKLAYTARRLSGLTCEITLQDNMMTSDLSEPRIRINRDVVELVSWNEEVWWEDYVTSMLEGSSC